MKIIHVLKGKPSPKTSNGVNTFVNGLSTNLSSFGIKVEVWSITKNNKVDFATNFSLKFFKKRITSLISYKLIQEIKNSRKEKHIFHFHSVFIFEFIQIAFLLRAYNIKYVVSPHSGYTSASLKKNFILKWVYIQLFEKRYVRKASGIQVNNPNEIACLFKNPNKLKMFISPNGIFMEEKQFNLTQNTEFTIGFMGRFSIQQKGLDLLISAFDKYSKKGGKGKLLLIGKGNLSQLLNSLEKKTIDKILVYDPLYGIQKEIKLKECSIFIHPSRWEGFPLSLVEAASLSIPLIVSDATNFIPYVVKYKAGISLNENTVQEITKSFHHAEKLFDENILQTTIARNSFEMAANEFSWGKISKNFINFYDSILTSGRL